MVTLITGIVVGVLAYKAGKRIGAGGCGDTVVDGVYTDVRDGLVGTVKVCKKALDKAGEAVEKAKEKKRAKKQAKNK